MRLDGSKTGGIFIDRLWAEAKQAKINGCLFRYFVNNEGATATAAITVVSSYPRPKQ